MSNRGILETGLKRSWKNVCNVVEKKIAKLNIFKESLGVWDGPVGVKKDPFLKSPHDTARAMTTACKQDVRLIIFPIWQFNKMGGTRGHEEDDPNCHFFVGFLHSPEQGKR